MNVNSINGEFYQNIIIDKIELIYNTRRVNYDAYKLITKKRPTLNFSDGRYSYVVHN